MAQRPNTVQSIVNPVDTSYLIKGEAYLVWGQERIDQLQEDTKNQSVTSLPEKVGALS